MKDYVNREPKDEGFKCYGKSKIRWYETNGFMSTLMLASVITTVLCAQW